MSDDDDWVSPRRIREDFVEPITPDIDAAYKRAWFLAIEQKRPTAGSTA